nr:hypothetical protein [Nostoc sp. ChiQUE02]MDZ8231811.1 hypothetical protein [Nostoc sp. ChiQUE02]
MGHSRRSDWQTVCVTAYTLVLGISNCIHYRTDRQSGRSVFEPLASDVVILTIPDFSADRRQHRQACPRSQHLL